MSPCGTHSLSECAMARTSPLAITTSMPPICVGISCLSPCRLPVGRRVIFLVAEWGECGGILAAPRHRLPPGQGQLNGSVWPKRFPFSGGNGVYIIRVNDTSWFLAVFPFFFSSLSLPLSSLSATKWHQDGCYPEHI